MKFWKNQETRNEIKSNQIHQSYTEIVAGPLKPPRPLFGYVRDAFILFVISFVIIFERHFIRHFCFYSFQVRHYMFHLYFESF